MSRHLSQKQVESRDGRLFHGYWLFEERTLGNIRRTAKVLGLLLLLLLRLLLLLLLLHIISVAHGALFAAKLFFVCITTTNIIYVAWFKASAARYMRTALFCVVTQRVFVISYGRFVTTYRSYIQGSRIQTLFFYSWPLKMWQIICPETSVRNNHYPLRNNPEERSCRHSYSPINVLIIAIVCDYDTACGSSITKKLQ